MRHDMGDDAATDHADLIGEASHAAGNLIHRMYYLAGLLEDGPDQAEAAEAFDQIKLSLAGLHRLVNRSMSLARPIDARPVPVPAADIVASIALRFGRDGDQHAKAIADLELGACEVTIDLMQFDRALGMLAEASGLLASGDEDDSPTAAVTGFDLHLDGVDGRSNNDCGGLVIQLRTERIRTPRGLPSDEVNRQISLALAARVLALFEWRIELDEHASSSCLSIFVPLSRVPTSLPTQRGDASL